jgi:hypothetical protein
VVAALPALTCVELSEHAVTEGHSEHVITEEHAVNVKVTGLGKVPDEGVTTTAYWPEEPIVIVAGPELLMLKLNAPPMVCTVRETEIFAVCEPDVPVT